MRLAIFLLAVAIHDIAVQNGATPLGDSAISISIMFFIMDIIELLVKVRKS